MQMLAMFSGLIKHMSEGQDSWPLSYEDCFSPFRSKSKFARIKIIFLLVNVWISICHSNYIESYYSISLDYIHYPAFYWIFYLDIW